MTAGAEPDRVVLEAVAQLARDLPHVDADTAWARLAHLTHEQRAEVERIVRDLAGAVKRHGEGDSMTDDDLESRLGIEAKEIVDYLRALGAEVTLRKVPSGGAAIAGGGRTHAHPGSIEMKVTWNEKTSAAWGPRPDDAVHAYCQDPVAMRNAPPDLSCIESHAAETETLVLTGGRAYAVYQARLLEDPLPGGAYGVSLRVSPTTARVADTQTELCRRMGVTLGAGPGRFTVTGGKDGPEEWWKVTKPGRMAG